MLDHGFAASAEEMEAVIRRIARAVSDECPPQVQDAPWLDRCIRDSVGQLWASPVKTFVPLLAWRQVRCCIRAGSCECGEC